MKTPFDTAAEVYDSEFTFSLIGRAQRKIVHGYLEDNLDKEKIHYVLELNCGTGEDAVFFAKKGFDVLATDVSEEMLKTTGDKIKSAGLENKICIRKLDINDLPGENFEKKFDLIFSNFGGINCIGKNTLDELTSSFRKILNPSGRVILIVLPSICLWEIIYFLFKGKFKEAFRRRRRSGLEVKIKDEKVTAYYYPPKELAKIFAPNFKIINLKPVGFFIPPSYMNNYFNKREKSFGILNKLEGYIKNRSSLSSLSDHFLIDMQVR
jgi:ubiquinone/menaquinone biosynthesis C-methylase UbiE